MPTSLNALLKNMVERGGTDLHITTNSPPQVRVDGVLRPLDGAAAHADRDQADRLLDPHRQPEAPARGGPRDRLLVRHQGPGPLPRQRLPPARRDRRGVPADPLRDPQLPRARAAGGGREDLREAARPGAGHRAHRLGQVDHAGGDARQGQPRARRAHRHDRGPGRVPAQRTRSCIVNQRELHADTHSFANALRSALRQDPDVVLIGEMRDLETVESALRIAETGHLTFATLHTNSAAQTINRIIDIFPAAPAGADPRAALVRARGHPLPVAAAPRERQGPRRWRWRSWSPTPRSAT